MRPFGFLKPNGSGHQILKYMKTATTLLFLLFANTMLLAQKISVSEVTQLPERITNNAVCEGFINDTAFIYTFGGLDSTKLYSGIHLRSYRYNIQKNNWNKISSLPDSLGKIASAASRIGNIIYITGGYHVFMDGSEISSNKVHRYDIVNNKFIKDGQAMPVPIDDHVQAVWRDSLIFVITGWSNKANVADVQIYDPNLNKWLKGTSVPDNDIYKSFGASGTIVGDTIYYFGGAASTKGFPIQNYLRKGIINPDDPTQIQWSNTVIRKSINGYRMASTSVHDKAYWIGGSGNTYNYNGIAYDKSGGVQPLNRELHLNNYKWEFEKNNQFPMDLRGIANISDTIKYIVGGMLENQKVSNKVYRLVWNIFY